MEKPSYQRILLKISGEGLAGEPGRGIDFAFVREVGQVIKACVAQGVQVGLVIGGGNFWRGAKDGGGNMERTRADQMGMLATVINSLAVQDVLEQIGQPARVLTSIPMGPVGQITSRAAAEEHFAAGRVVIFAGGTGNPYFSTDTAAVLRAAEIQADMILLAKNIDGVYSADPKKDPNAVKYDSITYDQVLADHLQVMDLTATSLALVLNELITNAIIHGFEGRREGLLAVTIRRDGPDGVIIVCDDGVGMSHAPVDTGRKHLGMAIVRTLIEKDMQGTIDFDDGVPEGTVVTIHFPLPERGE